MQNAEIVSIIFMSKSKVLPVSLVQLEKKKYSVLNRAIVQSKF